MKINNVFVFEIVEKKGMENIDMIRNRVIEKEKKISNGGIVYGIDGILNIGKEKRKIISENRKVINKNKNEIGKNSK